MNERLNIENEIIQLKPEPVKKYHVNSIGLFGSIVRSGFSKESDSDIIVEFNRPTGIEFVDLATLIEGKINRKVDLVSKKGIKEKYFIEIELEIIYGNL